jgi:hypothetical protein
MVLYESIKYHIMLGDGGFTYANKNRKYDSSYHPLASRLFPILCVIGDNDPIICMGNLPEVDIGIGEPVLLFDNKPYIAYLKKGKIYNIDGIKFLVLGGALMPNKTKRDIKYQRLCWECEHWSEKEKEDLFQLLEKDNKFDMVISHTGPHHINHKLFGDVIEFSDELSDEIALLNDEIHKKIQFIEWWCGHWRESVYHYDNETGHGYEYFYNHTRLIEKKEGKFRTTFGWGVDFLRK